jgi:hypothetical protein
MSLEEITELCRRQEEAERRQIEEQRRREEEQRRQEEEQQRREEAEQQLNEERLQIRDTILSEFLDACYIHLFLGLTIQKDRDSSNKGRPGER